MAETKSPAQTPAAAPPAASSSSALGGATYEIIRQLDGAALFINGVADHVHILASLPATAAPSEFVGKLKANSSKWMHENFPEQRAFAWQLGYSAFSVSVSQKQGVLDYIAGQEEHHRKVSFQEELIWFLKKHEIEYDERHVFE